MTIAAIPLVIRTGRPWISGVSVQQPTDRLDDHQDRDDEQGAAIDQRHDGRRLRLRSHPFADGHRDDPEQDGRRVSRVVATRREHAQGVRREADDDERHDHERVQAQQDAEPPPLRGGRCCHGETGLPG
jgi:hypothetical protein